MQLLAAISRFASNAASPTRFSSPVVRLWMAHGSAFDFELAIHRQPSLLRNPIIERSTPAFAVAPSSLCRGPWRCSPRSSGGRGPQPNAASRNTSAAGELLSPQLCISQSTLHPRCLRACDSHPAWASPRGWRVPVSCLIRRCGPRCTTPKELLHLVTVTAFVTR